MRKGEKRQRDFVKFFVFAVFFGAGPKKSENKQSRATKTCSNDVGHRRDVAWPTKQKKRKEVRFNLKRTNLFRSNPFFFVVTPLRTKRARANSFFGCCDCTRNVHINNARNARHKTNFFVVANSPNIFWDGRQTDCPIFVCFLLSFFWCRWRTDSVHILCVFSFGSAWRLADQTSFITYTYRSTDRAHFPHFFLVGHRTDKKARITINQSKDRLFVEVPGSRYLQLETVSFLKNPISYQVLSLQVLHIYRTKLTSDLIENLQEKLF